jgi:hypothetical protein
MTGWHELRLAEPETSTAVYVCPRESLSFARSVRLTASYLINRIITYRGCSQEVLAAIMKNSLECR